MSCLHRKSKAFRWKNEVLKLPPRFYNLLTQYFLFGKPGLQKSHVLRHAQRPRTSPGEVRRGGFRGGHTGEWATAREKNVGAGLRPELWAAGMPPLLSHPGGVRRDESRLYVADILPRRPPPRRVCAIWQSVNADAHLRPPFSVVFVRPCDPPTDPSHGFRFPSHGIADPSHGNFDPRPLFSGKIASICAI